MYSCVGRHRKATATFCRCTPVAQVYLLLQEVCPSTDPTAWARPNEPLHSMSAHSPFRSITNNTLSHCHLQSLATDVLQYINILSQHLYPNGTALSGWSHIWLKAVAMQPKGLQVRWVLSYCTIYCTIFLLPITVQSPSESVNKDERNVTPL